MDASLFGVRRWSLMAVVVCCRVGMGRSGLCCVVDGLGDGTRTEHRESDDDSRLERNTGTSCSQSLDSGFGAVLRFPSSRVIGRHGRSEPSNHVLRILGCVGSLLSLRPPRTERHQECERQHNQLPTLQSTCTPTAWNTSVKVRHGETRCLPPPVSTIITGIVEAAAW